MKVFEIRVYLPDNTENRCNEIGDSCQFNCGPVCILFPGSILGSRGEGYYYMLDECPAKKK